MEISKSGKEIESHAEEDRLSMTTIQKMQDLPTAFIINFDGDHPTTEDSGRLGPFMPPKKLLQRERLRQATKQENTMKRDTREVDDKMNNNNDDDTSQENQTLDDGKIEIVADRKYRHFEPSGTGSDTGTYTVENEEDEDKLKLADKAVASPCLEEDKGFRSEEIQTESSRWVSEWASKTTSMEQPYSDEISLPSSSSERSRRKLPATPRVISEAAKSALPNDSLLQSESTDEIETKNYLLDTYTLMTELEARLHVREECSITQLPKNEGIEETVSTHLKDHCISTSYRANDSEDSSKTNTHTSQEKASLSVSHSSSVNLSLSQPKYFKSKPTKINRAFMLRQQLNTKTNVQNLPQNRNKKPIPTLEEGISRFEVGRHSARKPKGPMNKIYNEGRCNSTLSPKEAEYQAWKRRQTYKPGHLASQRPRNQSPITSITAAAAFKTEQKTSQNESVSQCRKSSRSKNALCETSDTLQRSASFHYPDGLHKIQRNVFLSEDDSKVKEGISGVSSLPASGQISELLELGDDELILPINVCNSTRVCRESTRLEALDNLVISTLLSISVKLCATSTSLLHHVRMKSSNPEERRVAETLLYILDDVDEPVSGAKKSSKELASVLRNLKKVEQALETVDAAFHGI